MFNFLKNVVCFKKLLTFNSNFKKKKERKESFVYVKFFYYFVHFQLYPTVQLTITV